MFLGRVTGCVWSTIKDRQLEGRRFLVVQPLSPDLKPVGKRLVCADFPGAGAGELIYYCRGKEAALAFLPDDVPVDATVIGIVDSVHVAEN